MSLRLYESSTLRENLLDKGKEMAENISSGTFDNSYPPIVSVRAPRTTDRAEVGTLWICPSLNDAWIITSARGGISTWINIGGGSGTFASLSVIGNAVITTGNLEVTAGTLTMGTFGRGLVFSSATGVLSSAAGTDGQLVVGATGAAPLWASLASSDGSVGIAVGANTIDLTVTGATGSSFPTDGAIVVPLAGATSIVGDTNITTDGAVANTVTINLNPSVSLVGKLTAGNDLEMTTGTCLIASDDNAANAIYLHANGGVNETIHLYSQLGTGVASLNFESLVGGIYMSAGTALSLNAATASEINITNNSFAIATGTGALNLGIDAAHTVTLGSAIAAASTVVNSGTGPLNITGLGAMTLSAVGLLKIDSSAGRIDIGTDVVAQNINIGTGAAVRTVSLCNSTGASSFVAHCGTGAFDLGVDATDHTTRIGSTSGVSAFTAQAGTGTMTFTAGGAFDVNAVGAATIDSVGNIELNTSAGAINIATDAVAVVTTIGNITGVSQVVMDCGTAGVSVGASATAHASIFGSTNTTSNTTVQSGSGVLVLSGAGDITIDSAGVLELNSSAGVISIGNDAVSQAVNVATAGASFGADANAHTTTIGSTNTTSTTTIQSGTGGIGLAAAGLVSITAATDSQAGAAVTINANVGKGVFTGLTTAAGATQDFTITNSLVTAASGIIYSIANLGANDAQMQITRMIPGAGSFVVSVKNIGAAALNGDVIISFIVLG